MALRTIKECCNCRADTQTGHVRQLITVGLMLTLLLLPPERWQAMRPPVGSTSTSYRSIIKSVSAVIVPAAMLPAQVFPLSTQDV
jgi:hypothetical protein